jgi:hypothetical protein
MGRRDAQGRAPGADPSDDPECENLFHWTQTDWEALFLSRAQRRVRLDATFSMEGQLWEGPLHLRGQFIQVRFNPFDWRRAEIWCEDEYVSPARRCYRPLNSKTYTDRNYDRPVKPA